jgi:Na+-transporting methylmalonyl-CoA/oxaloacetate decarboxylase gamma subunit
MAMDMFKEGSPNYRKGVVIVLTVWVSILLLVVYLIGKAAGFIS